MTKSEVEDGVVRLFGHAPARCRHASPGTEWSGPPFTRGYPFGPKSSADKRSGASILLSQTMTKPNKQQIRCRVKVKYLQQNMSVLSCEK
jgi:hypothetical protein